MRNIRRFQRTFFTLLLGINVLVFSFSINHDFYMALGHSLMCMLCCGSLLLLISFSRKTWQSRRIVLNRSLEENPRNFEA